MMKKHAILLFMLIAYWQTSNSTEGIKTVGIIGNSKYTDNKLRKEQGLNEKIKY